jgi:hypothetical protein
MNRGSGYFLAFKNRKPILTGRRSGIGGNQTVRAVLPAPPGPLPVRVYVDRSRANPAPFGHL